jgi:GNAT superfamily N-acetyltransferase
MNLSFTIKPLAKFSAVAIRNLRNELTLRSEHYGYSLMGERLEGELKKRGSSKDIAVVARLNGRLVGWSCIMPGRRSASTRLMFYVKPQYRRKGVASALLNRTTKYLKHKGYKAVYAATWDSRSDGFYKNMGFKEQDICDRFDYKMGLS